MFKGKRILAFVLMVVMLLSVFPAFAFAEEVSSTGRTNLALNGGFDDDSTWNWGTNGAYADGCGKITNDGTVDQPWILQTIKLEAGKEYKVTVRYKGTFAEGDNAQIRIRLRNSSKTILKSFEAAPTTVQNGDEWGTIEYTFTALTDTADALFYLRLSGKKLVSECYFDDFAVYDMSEQLYTVTWKNYDGTVLETDNDVPANTTPEYNGAVPERPADAEYTYTFAGWSPVIAPVTGDVVYTAQFDSEAIAVEGTNLALNGSFEENSTWNMGAAGGYSTDCAVTGDRSAKITNDGTKDKPWILQTLSLEVGKTYKVSVRYKGTFADDDDVQIRIRMRKSDKSTYVKTYEVAPTTVQNGEEWGVIEYEFEVLEETADVMFYLRLKGKNLVSTCYFDDFAVYDLSATSEIEPTDVYGSNITLGSDLTMNFYFDAAKVESTGYAVIARDGYADTKVELATCGKDASGAYYKIPYAGLNAKEMNDTLTVTVYNAEDVAVSTTYTDSIRAYCERNIDKTAAQLGIDETKLDAFRTLIVDMLNYGAAAQVNGNYNTGNLANAGLSATQKNYGTNTNPTCENNRTVSVENIYYGTSFNMENEISMNLYVLTSAIEGGKVEVAFKDHYGADQTQTILAENCTTNGGYTCFKVDSVVAADGRQPITCNFYDANGDLLVTVVDSMESYVARMGGEYEWLYEVMKYSDAAKAYLH